MEYIHRTETPLGPVLLASDGEALTGLWFEGQKHYAATLTGPCEERGGPRPSARAVGGAVGRNPISLIIPCHRVVGADGSLTGYAGGLDRKERLLQLESCIIPR